MIRRDAQKASDPSPTSESLRAADLLKLIGKFDLVVVDEGHYETCDLLEQGDFATPICRRCSSAPRRIATTTNPFVVRGQVSCSISRSTTRSTNGSSAKPRFEKLDGFSRLPSTASISPLSEFTDDTESDARLGARDRAGRRQVREGSRARREKRSTRHPGSPIRR